MPDAEKKKSPSRSRKNSPARRSRSRTRKTNQYLLVGRDSSVSVTRVTANGCGNGRLRTTNVTTEIKLARPSRPGRLIRPRQSPATLQIDLISLGLFALALILRLWNIPHPSSVVFDELLSGAQINGYFTREMYFSLDPPLSSQLYSAVAFLYGSHEEFQLDEVGADYPSGVPFVLWRAVSAVIGSLIVPAAYHCMKSSGVSLTSSALPAFLLAVDPSHIVQSRIFTAESLVISMSMLALWSAISYSKVETYKSCAAIRLAAAGIFSGLALSMRYSVTFTYLLTLYIIAAKLWKNVADRDYSAAALWGRLIAVVMAMIVVPVCIYLASWTVHVTWLHLPNSKDTSHAHYRISSALQLTEAKFTPKVVTNGSTVTLRHIHGRRCWLHSHPLLYPKRYSDGRGSSHQQQVTCYPFVDNNNKWTVIKVNASAVSGDGEANIRHGDVVSLVHTATGRYLNSHHVAAPLTPSKQEVSCYVDHNVSMPAQPGWVLEVDNREEDADDWLASRSEIKLIHINTSAALSVTSKHLPDWGRGQYETVADAFTFHENTLWVADDLSTPRYLHGNVTNNVSEVSVLSTASKIYKIHKTMFLHCYEYTDDHQYSSSPFSWPLGLHNLIYWIHPSSGVQIHLLPNIPSWSMSFLCLVLLCLWSLLMPVVSRSPTHIPLAMRRDFSGHLLICMGGYLINMLPHFLTDTPLLLYNYLPALVFCQMSLGYVHMYSLQLLTGCCWRLLVHSIVLLVVMSSMAFSCWVLPLVYGMEQGQQQLISQLQMHVGWKFI